MIELKRGNVLMLYMIFFYGYVMKGLGLRMELLSWELFECGGLGCGDCGVCDD